MPTKTRNELRNYFKKGDKPTANNFTDLIDASINLQEDGVEKPSISDKKPLKIIALGDGEKWLDFSTLQDTNNWQINRRINTTSKAGFNLTYSESSKLFIGNDGTVGINNANPQAMLHIKQNTTSELFRVEGIKSGTSTSLLTLNATDGLQLQNGTSLKVTGSLTVEGIDGLTINTKTGYLRAVGGIALSVPEGTGATFRSNHIEADGAFYCYKDGQVYMTVDDQFYIRQKDSTNANADNKRFYFNTSNGVLDLMDARGALKFNSNDKMKIFGAMRANSAAVVVAGQWDELEIKGRMIDWTVANLHLGWGNDYSTLGDGKGYIIIGDNNSKVKALQLKGATQLEVNGLATLRGGLTFGNAGVSSHIEDDGAFYRYTDGQVYITVDDQFYIRKRYSSDNANTIYFNVADKTIKIAGEKVPTIDKLYKCLYEIIRYFETQGNQREDTYGKIADWLDLSQERRDEWRKFYN